MRIRIVEIWLLMYSCFAANLLLWLVNGKPVFALYTLILLSVLLWEWIYHRDSSS